MTSPNHNSHSFDPLPPVIVAVTGGIAAYKIADLVSRIKKMSIDVQVIMTDAATKFVSPLTFEALSGRKTFTTLFPDTEPQHANDVYPHLYPATGCAVFMVAPATADIIAKLANGVGDDIVSTSALSLPASCRRFFAPAMNVEMWRQPAVKQNVARLEQLGWTRIGPDAGDLACGMTGEGRMSEPATLAHVIATSLSEFTTEAVSLAGKNVTIFSGPTVEYLDPVRYISNASSGKMGKSLAEAAVARGADVHLITGPVPAINLPMSNAIRVEKITSAEELLSAGQRSFSRSNVVIYAAAVSDYRPAVRRQEKLPKTSGNFALELEATPDVAATLNRQKRPDQVAIGFALQSHDGERLAVEKMKAKKFDGIVLNSPEALGQDSATYTFFDAASNHGDAWGTLTKRQCADKILNFAANLVKP